MVEEMPANKVDHGHNVKYLRRVLGYSPERLAYELDISLQDLAELENRQIIDDNTLKGIVEAMKLSVGRIKEMTDEEWTYNFHNKENTLHDNSSINNIVNNPVEKIIELYNDKIAMYEKLLQAEREKNELIQKYQNNK